MQMPSFPAIVRKERPEGRAGDASLLSGLKRLLLAAGGLLLILTIAQLGALTVNRTITTRLVEQRIAPMSQLQTIAAAYRTGWTIADKVRLGTVGAPGGAAALKDIRLRLADDWADLRKSAPDIATRFADAQPDADRTLLRLEALLERNDVQGLEFFASGQFYSSVDPLLGRIASTTEELRQTAGQDRAVLRWVNFTAEIILIGVLLGAIAGGTLLAHMGERQLIRPLDAIARHLRDNDEDVIPGLDRADEIGAIAKALAQARESEQLAQALRLEQERAEESLRQLEQEEQARRQALEETLRARELEEARAGQMRARLFDEHFARFDGVLSQLVAALSDASTVMRDMAETLAGSSAQSSDRAELVARSMAAAATRVDAVQKDSRALLNLVADMRGSAGTTRSHGREVIAQSSRNRAQAQLLSEMVEGITRALNIISGIASQTNMLSINANIEAHRSGSEGLGFAVVAREIKLLAVDSGRAAAEIGQQLAGINQTASNFLASASLVEQLATHVGQQADTVETLAGSQEEAGRRMAASIAQTRDEISEINAAAQEAREGSAELVHAAHKLRDTADSIAGQVAELSRAFSALRVDLSQAA